MAAGNYDAQTPRIRLTNFPHGGSACLRGARAASLLVQAACLDAFQL
ncbi:MAG TPA: hypothetical protein VJ719_06980 [Chthoniobacterales bacterium]|nr:hypothetical protein [Chthoniobacterales bacterium]